MIVRSERSRSAGACTPDYSSAGPAGLLIALTSGGTQIARPIELRLAEDLLAFDNDTDVIDFASELGRGDLGRFGSLVKDIVDGARSEEELKERVRTWNREVQRYERRPDRIQKFNLVGLVAALAAQASGSETLKSLLPLVALALPFLQTKNNEDLIQRSGTLGRLLDWANGNASRTSTRAVLLSRMRRRVQGLRMP